MNSPKIMKAEPSRLFRVERSKPKNVFLTGFLLCLICSVWALPGTATASTFLSATAATEGDGLRIDFVEKGLQPGQNYDYVGFSSSATETFQCYHSRTFTPTGRTFSVMTTNFYPDVRIYKANKRGIVRGFVYVYPVLPPFHGCGKGLETVPIAITLHNFSLVNGVTFDVIDVSGIFSGAIEPD
jgi:hypothetical protein